MLDGIITCSDDKKFYSIVLVNKHPEKEIECNIGLKVNKKIDATILSGDSPDAYNDLEKPDRVVPVVKELSVNDGMVLLPAHSLVILQLKMD